VLRQNFRGEPASVLSAPRPELLICCGSTGLYKMQSWQGKPVYRVAWVLGLALVASVLSVPARAQRVEEALDQSYNAMYNLQFDEALRRIEEAKTLAPDDPLPWMAQACAVLFREFDRLHILNSEMFASDEKFASRSAHAWDAASRKQFDAALDGAEKLAQQRLARDRNDVRSLFAMTIVNGLRADDSALIGKKNLAALGYTKTANGYAERLLSRAPDYYDAYLATGMGKYLIGGKAAPVRWVLRLGGLKGDQEVGLKELRMTAEHGHYLAPFATILLAFDDLRHKNKTEARKKLLWLSEQFPNNPHFQEEMTKLDHPSPGTGQ
jgi:tetratricopeptide (TPR) repeat protein